MLYSLKKGAPTLKPDSLSLSAAERGALAASGENQFTKWNRISRLNQVQKALRTHSSTVRNVSLPSRLEPTVWLWTDFDLAINSLAQLTFCHL